MANANPPSQEGQPTTVADPPDEPRAGETVSTASPVETPAGAEPGAGEGDSADALSQNEIERLLAGQGAADSSPTTPASQETPGASNSGGEPAQPPAFPADDAQPAESVAALEDGLGEVLSQSEVERLLTQVQAEETKATVLKPGGQKARLKNDNIQPCDFRQPAFLTGGELRKIRLRHEEFIRCLAAHLSIYLRLEVVIHMSKLQTLSYQKYTDSLANPTHLTLFKVEPLKGVCLLDMTPRLGLTVVDRLLGGPAHSAGFNGELSEIETALLDQVAQLILNEWCQLWQRIENARPVVLGHENNGRFLNSSAHDSVMLILSMEVRLGDCIEQMSLAFPFLTIEPLIRLAGQAAEDELNPGAESPARPQWNVSYDDVQIRLYTEWQGLEVSARELSTLKCGDVLMLGQGCFDRVEVRLEQLPKFYGRLGTVGDHRAVELTEPLKS